MKKIVGSRFFACVLSLALLLALIPAALAAENPDGWFYFSASTDQKTVVAPEKISYAPGATILEALTASGHSFTGIEDDMVSAIDGVVGNYVRSDENGGHDMDRLAAEIRFFSFSEQESFLSAARQLLISEMADYAEEAEDVRAAAKSAYDDALSGFARADDARAEKLAQALSDAIERYKRAQEGDSFEILFTDGTDAYTAARYPDIEITAVNDYGRRYTDEDGDGMLRLVAGDYSFSVVQGFNRIDGEIHVSGAQTVSAQLPSGEWMKEGARISLNQGASFEESELAVEFGAHTMRVLVPDDYATGAYYLLASYNKELFPEEAQAPKLYALYTRTDGTVVNPETNPNSSKRAWESRYSSVSGVLSTGAEGSEVLYRVSRTDENGYVCSQEYTLYLDRALTLSGLRVFDQDGVGQGSTEVFAPHKRAYTYRILSTVKTLRLAPEAFGKDYAVTVNGTPLADLEPIAVQDGTELTIGLSKNGYTGSYTLTFRQAAGKSITFNTTGKDVDVSVYNLNGEEMLSVKERQTSGFYAYRFTLVPGETYTYVATQNEFYHVTNTFTLEESANGTVTVSVKTQDWLKTLAFGETLQLDPALALDQAFSPENHRYTLHMQDRKSSLAAGATASVSDVSLSAFYHKITSYASSNGTEAKVTLGSGAKKLADAVQSNALGNEITIRASLVEDGVTYYQDYIVQIERTLTLESLEARYSGASLLLEPAYTPDTAQYAVTVPMGAASMELAAKLRSSVPTPFGAADAGYYLLVNGEPCENGSASVPLNGTEETETVTVGVRSTQAPEAQTDIVLTVRKVPPVTLRTEIPTQDALLVLWDAATGERLWPDENDSWSLSKGFDYGYILTAPGFVGLKGSLCIDDDKDGQTVLTRSDGVTAEVSADDTGALSALLKLSLDPAQENTAIDHRMEAEWADFRGTSFRYDAEKDALVPGGTNYTNNGVTSVKTPISAGDSTLFWATKLGDGYSGKATGCPILVDGDLIVYAEKTIYRVDTVSGKILARAEMCEASSFAINNAAYYDGMVFVGLSGGRIQAFDADTLNSLWVYRDEKGGQPNCPLTVYDGYLYTGFWQGETSEANFVCLSVTDENPAQTLESKLPTWTYTHRGGFYWAGAYVCKDFLLVGADDGQTSYTDGTKPNETGALLLFDRKTGRVLDSRHDLMADVRSTICYDEETGAYYFTTKGGYFYRAYIAQDESGLWKISKVEGLKLSNYAELENNPAMSTSAPVIYKKRAYIGVSGTGQFVAYSGHNLTVIDLKDWSIAYKVRTQGYPQTSGLLTTAYEQTGSVYVYFFDNATPGKLRVLKDSAGQTAPQFVTKERYTDKGSTTVYDTPYALFTPTGKLAEYAICSPIVDEYGTIYFKNDSARLMAFGSNITLEVTSMPQKTTYAAGDVFDPTGMTVIAHYANGASRDVTKYVTYQTEPLTAEDAEFTITFPYVMYHNENGDDGTSEAGVTTLKPHVSIALQITGEARVLPGDVNGDGEVNNLDAAMVYAKYNGKLELSDAQKKAADVNGNGEVNNLDAALIYAYYNGKLKSFPAEK